MEHTVNIDGIEIRLAHPDELNLEWVGRDELKLQLHAAWLRVDARDLPLNPRLIGKPGVGKTTLAYAVARELKRDVYLYQSTMDTRPEDLIITPVIAANQKLRYVASPIVSAMLTGGIAILDEGNRMSEKAWAALAPLLDQRRYVESIVAGVKIRAHDDFRFCATMNEDASTFDVPEYIHSRLQPQILIDFPEADEERMILARAVPFADKELIDYVVGFLQAAHKADEPYTVRDGINLTRYTVKLGRSQTKPADKVSNSANLDRAVRMILGETAAVYLP